MEIQGSQSPQQNPNPAPEPAEPPVKPRPAPEPAPEPSPGRPSPRPGEKPSPVTDPKNYLEPLPGHYYHTVSKEMRSHLSGSELFGAEQDLSRLEDRVLQDREQTTARRDSIDARFDERKLPDRILYLQRGIEDHLYKMVLEYMEDVFGGLYHSIHENLDIAWKDPYDLNEQSEESMKRESQRKRSEDRDLKDENITWDYLKETILRSEFYYQLIQGFGILYMDGFFRMNRNRMDRLNSELAGRYEEYHLNGHFMHHRVFQEVMEGKKLPEGVDKRMESQKSHGRVWHTTDPVEDLESGNVIGMKSTAHARSLYGIVLVHEALKGAFQLLTPWARLNENYLRENELNIHRTALNSYWAEIRQFAMGPSFFRMVQDFLDDVGIPANTSNPEFFIALQNIVLLPSNKLQEVLDSILSGQPVPDSRKGKWKELFLADLS